MSASTTQEQRNQGSGINVRVGDLSKAFRRSSFTLQDVSFELSCGITALLGPNGAGKSTLLRCLLGIIKPDSGTIHFKDKGTKNSQTGYLPQAFGLFPELSVHDALAMLALLKNIPQNRIDAEIDEKLAEVNLSDQRRTRVGSLSGGMIRRLGIAQALLGDPPVLLFDEPTAGLDPEERVRFRRIISHLSADMTRSTLVSTHIVSDVENLAQHIIVLDAGRVAALGAPAEIAEAARGKSFEIPATQVNEFTESYFVVGYEERREGKIARLLAAKPEAHFKPVEPSLEDGYLCITKHIGLIG